MIDDSCGFGEEALRGVGGAPEQQPESIEPALLADPCRQGRPPKALAAGVPVEQSERDVAISAHLHTRRRHSVTPCKKAHMLKNAGLTAKWSQSLHCRPGTWWRSAKQPRQ